MGILSAFFGALWRAIGRGASAVTEPTEQPAPQTPEQAYGRAVDAWALAVARSARRPRWLPWKGPEVPPPPEAPQRTVVVTLSATSATTDAEEPSVRACNVWTPQLIRNAQRYAESGNISRVADLCEEILGDDRAVAVLNTRANALLGCDVAFDEGIGRRKKRAVKALEAEEDYWTAFPEEELRRLIIWGVLLGIGIAQIRWEDKTPGDVFSRKIPRIRVWHPRFLRWDWTERRWYLTVDDYGREIPIEPGKGGWILFTPYGSSRPWAYGLWRGMARLWLLKQYAIDDWALHSEVHGQPIRMGFLPPEAAKMVDEAKRKKLRAELAADIASFGKETSFVPPPGFDFKLVEAQANTWEMFKAQIDLADTGFSVLAIGTSLPTDVKPGVGTGATASTLVRQDYLEADAETLTTTLHDQALIWWADINFGDPRLAPWPVYQVEPAADLKAMAERVNTAANALRVFDDVGAPVDKREFLKSFEVPLLPEGVKATRPIFAYHMQYQIVTVNQVLESLGYEPITGGDRYPVPVTAQPATPAQLPAPPMSPVLPTAAPKSNGVAKLS